MTPEPGGGMPDHSALLSPDIRSIIERAHWHSASTTEDVAPHQYVVRGWDRDDVTDDEFDLVRDAIKAHGRAEVWTPPAEWVRRWGGRPMTNSYLYVGGFAYWFTFPRGRVPMLNREHVSVQEATPTRRVPDPPAQTQLDI